MNNPLPFSADYLEQQAANERERLHQSVTELRSSVRQRLDVRTAAQSYLWPISAAAGMLAFALGYGIAAIFVG